jgi:hypothetical protein
MTAAMDYGLPPVPPFSEADAVWVEILLREKGLP